MNPEVNKEQPMQWHRTALPLTVFGLQGELMFCGILWMVWPTFGMAMTVLKLWGVAILMKLLGVSFTTIIPRFRRWIFGNRRPIGFARAAIRRINGYL
ncbi:hypothetical protein [Marinobacterium jannaschii]|uniref:hypothetical protein n=1 Tax=Marinobacterium jannaschii TaxID=64970 RepID=UPI000484F645|nr:hypothetical protein [Marinobacterium jannaschii]